MATPQHGETRISQDIVPKRTSLDAPRDVAPSSPSTASRSTDVHYTVLIRIPFPRGDFVDPPLVDWDPSKDKALWKILSRNPRSSDIDWKALATKFDVTLPFILQQAAWLYERQLSQVRAQMRRVSRTSLNATTQSTAVGDESREARGAGSRRPSALAVQTRAQALETLEGNAPGTPKQNVGPPAVFRTTSTSTVTQAKMERSSRLHQRSRETIRRTSFAKQPELSATVKEEEESRERPRSKSSSPPSSSSSSSGSENDAVQRAPRRPISRFARGRNPLFKSVHNKRESDEDDEEEDEAPAFLIRDTGDNRKDGATTARNRIPERHRASFVSSPEPSSPKVLQGANPSGKSDASGNVPGQKGKISQATKPSMGTRPSNTGRPTATTQGKPGDGKQASEGTPSMGSSFSDLDDGSVTQSALEEALMSKMQYGTGSRMSTSSNAMGSRYR